MFPCTSLSLSTYIFLKIDNIQYANDTCDPVLSKNKETRCKGDESFLSH